jgi:hypothetical protein
MAALLKSTKMHDVSDGYKFQSSDKSLESAPLKCLSLLRSARNILRVERLDLE